MSPQVAGAVAQLPKFCGWPKDLLQPRIDAVAILVRLLSVLFTSVGGAGGKAGWVRIVMARVSKQTMKELVRESWCNVAPAELQSDICNTWNGSGTKSSGNTE